jgi:ferredoxin/flavodoxin---NADP+ reductase
VKSSSNPGPDASPEAAPPVGSTPERPLRVAIVGAGPSGFYVAQDLLKKKDLHASIDLFDRLPAPFGLVRYGVAPDHQKIKLVSRVFEKVAEDDRVRFFGNVSFGRDVHLEDLLACYDQVVFAVGGQTDRKLGVPGEDLTGSHSSTEFVYWYSGHPDYVDLAMPMDHREAVVVGIGNVAMDVARILARTADDLATTDIADPALDALRESQITDIHVLSRRGPAQAKCTPTELKELGEIEGVRVVVDPRDLDLDEDSAREAEDDRQTQRNLEVLWDYAGRHEDEAGRKLARRRIHLHFLASPVEIEGRDGGERVTGVTVERNRLEPTDSGYLNAVGTGERWTIPATLVVRAVGYRSVKLPEVPFDDRRGVIPNAAGRVLDPETREPVPRLYAVGWVKRGPSGLIGSNKPDAVETVEAMLADLPDRQGTPDPGPDAVERLLDQRGVCFVRYDHWRKLDELEVERGGACGRPRVKFCRVEEMLEALGLPETEPALP